MSSELYCATKRNTCSKVLQWDVCDLDWHFDLNKLEKFGALSSPIYGVENQAEKLEWKIHMFGENSRGMFSSPKWVSISLEYLGRSGKSKSRGVKCKYSIQVGRDGEKESMYKLTDRHKFSQNSKGSSLRIPFNEFFKNKPKLFPENTLRITVKLEVDGKPLHTGNAKLERQQSISPENWSFGQFLCNNKFSDVTISCDGKTFPAHKVFLANNSSVFAKMFDNDESLKEIPVKELRPETVKDMLKYIYTGKFDESKKVEQILRLLECASQYELQALKSACFQQLTLSLTDDNVGDIAVAGFVFKVDEKMLQICKDYCRRRHCQLMKSSKFQKAFKEHLDAFI